MSSYELERVLTRAQLRQYVPYSDTHLRRLEKRGLFPKRIKLGPSRVCWLEREVFDWVQLRKAESKV